MAGFMYPHSPRGPVTMFCFWEPEVTLFGQKAGAPNYQLATELAAQAMAAKCTHNLGITPAHTK